LNPRGSTCCGTYTRRRFHSPNQCAITASSVAPPGHAVTSSTSAFEAITASWPFVGRSIRPNRHRAGMEACTPYCGSDLLPWVLCLMMFTPCLVFHRSAGRDCSSHSCAALASTIHLRIGRPMAFDFACHRSMIPENWPVSGS
jgi:hypothetical protein